MRQETEQRAVRLGFASGHEQGFALQQCKHRVVHSFQGFQPGNRGKRLFGLAIQYEQMRQRPENAGISRRKLRGDKQVRSAPLGLSVAAVEIAQDMQQMDGVIRVGQISIPSCMRPSRSR